MSRLIKLWVGNIHFVSGVGGTAPLYSLPNSSSKLLARIPSTEKCVLAFFVEWDVAAPLIGNLVDPDRMWLRIIYLDTVGWVSGRHLVKLFELDLDHNGVMVEKQVYPHNEED